MKESTLSKQEIKEEIMGICKKDRQFAEQLYSELYIYLNYDESLIEVDCQSCEMQPEEKKPTWAQNFIYRVKSALRMKGIEVELDTDEVVSIIRQSTLSYGYSI